MKTNNKCHSSVQKFYFLATPDPKKLFIIMVLVAVLFFQPILISKSFGKEGEKGNIRFYVVSSYKNFDDADKLVKTLKAKGYDPFGKTVNIPNKGDWRRVYVKDYKNKKEALSAGKKLREKDVLKDFFLLTKTEPKNKKTALPTKKNKKDNRITPTPEVLAKKNSLDARAKTKQNVNLTKAKKKEDPQPIDEIVFTVTKKIEYDLRTTKEKIDFTVTKEKKDVFSTKEKTGPPNSGEIKPPLKIIKDKLDKGLDMDKKPYDIAMIDFSAERYEEALIKFQDIAKTVKNEAVMRRIADCYYFLGEKGNKRYFAKAIDQFTNIIRDYPGSKKDNAKAIYKLAQSYIRTELYSSALVNFKSLSTEYPETVYFPISVFMMGKMYYKMGNFKGAIIHFKDYIAKFPDGQHVRVAYFGVGDSYFQLRQFYDANLWYGNALKRWPILEDVPEDTSLNLGTHFFQVKKYEEAQRVLFVYLNLFPGNKNGRTALYNIAKSFEKMGKLPSALKTFSLIVGRYPESQEARQSAVIMANIGAKHPKIKLPEYILAGMDNYKNPIEAYDKLSGKLFDLDWEEEVVFRKGWAHAKMKKYGKAFDTFNLQLKKFPYGKNRTAGEKHLVLSANGLINDFYSKKDYLAVSEVYFNSDRKVLFENGDFDMLFKIGNSLQIIGLYGQAAGFFDEMVKVFKKDKRVNKLLFALAKIDYNQSAYESARNRLKKLLDRPLGLDKKRVMNAKELLGDVCYKEGLFKEAVGFYLEVLAPQKGVEDSSVIRKKYADSLSGMGLYSAAYVNYKRVLKDCGEAGNKCLTPVIKGSYAGLGDCLYNEGKYQKAITMYEKSLNSSSEGQKDLWAIFNIGRGYANLGNKPMADKSFSALKEESGNEFWSRMKNYYPVDKAGKEI